MGEFTELLNFSLINIDKPSGPTSYSISEYIRREIKLNKTSHMGTLDPKVTGVLPITLGRACKLASYFITHDKTYTGILHTHKPQTTKTIQELINKHFTGMIKQTPPHRSAVKRAERTRKVYYFNIKETDNTNKEFLFETKVEGGTYIRKICSDLGEMIGGAHMGELRRTAAGIFNEKTCVRLEEFDKAIEQYKKNNVTPLKNMLVNAEEAIKQVLTQAHVHKQALKSLHNGKPLHKKDLLPPIPQLLTEERFALFCENTLVGIYKKTDEENIYARPEFVKD